jgi:serine/threonine protein kinase
VPAARSLCPFAEEDVASIVESLRSAHAPQPTPLFNTDAFRLSRPASAAEASLPEIQPSDIEEIPGYELLGVLGRGGMGIVFRARQISLKRQVALKMILTGRHARSEDRRRFQQEAEAVARLQHPNIVHIYEVGQQNGLPYYSLEFVNAGSLEQFLRGVPQAPQVAAQLVLQLAEAMHYAHKRGIVHRDLKPANILLHLDESRIVRKGQSADPAVFRELQSYLPKISDFGLAKDLSGDEQVRQGMIVGTPSYMAPEQAGGRGHVGPAADVYSLGAILYEMLTGRPPFRGTNVQETAQQVLSQEPVPPRQLQPKVPLDLETICLACLQKDPAARYASAEALGEDLRRFLDHEPILARPTPLPDRVVQWAHGRPGTTVALAAGALLAAVLMLAWNELSWSRDQREQVQADFIQSEARLQEALAAIDDITRDADARTLIKAALFCESVAEKARARPALRPVAAEALVRLAALKERLGDRPAAIANLGKALEIFEQLVADFPDRPNFALRLADCREQREQWAK